MRVVDAASIAGYDRWAIEAVGVPEMVLMEHAALAVADAVANEFPGCRTPGIVCGPGNNGGDGLAAARLLAVRGYSVLLVLAVPRQKLRGSALAQLEICERLGLEPQTVKLDDPLPDCDLWVDALFGTGLDRPLDGDMRRWVEALRRQHAPVLAVDLPSGLNASLAQPIGPHVTAQVTVTFGAPKVAQVLEPTRGAVGKLLVADLGLPWVDLEEEEKAPVLELVELEGLRALFPKRHSDSHKGDYGHLLVVAGSVGMSGAARLASAGALRGGAGLVTLATPGKVRAECAAASAEVMTVALGEGSASLELEQLEQLEQLTGPLARATAVALGPGLGTGDGVSKAVRRLVEEVALPLVLDADGLNALAGNLTPLAVRAQPTVLTPHPGEMARLLGASTGEVQDDRVAAVRMAAERSGAVVVLKGSRSLVCSPEGDVYINPTGNPGMATGGCGDVLTGVIGALLARGFDALGAAVLGVWLHGRAGDVAARRCGEESLIAGDLPDCLGQAFRELEGSATDGEVVAGEGPDAE